MRSISLFITFIVVFALIAFAVYLSTYIERAEASSGGARISNVSFYWADSFHGSTGRKYLIVEYYVESPGTVEWTCTPINMPNGFSKVKHTTWYNVTGQMTDLITWVTGWSGKLTYEVSLTQGTAPGYSSSGVASTG